FTILASVVILHNHDGGVREIVYMHVATRRAGGQITTWSNRRNFRVVRSSHQRWDTMGGFQHRNCPRPLEILFESDPSRRKRTPAPALLRTSCCLKRSSSSRNDPPCLVILLMSACTRT